METDSIISWNEESPAQETLRDPGLSQAFGWCELTSSDHGVEPAQGRAETRRGRSTQAWCGSSSPPSLRGHCCLFSGTPGGGEAQTGPYFCMRHPLPALLGRREQSPPGSTDCALSPRGRSDRWGRRCPLFSGPPCLLPFSVRVAALSPAPCEPGPVLGSFR